MRSSPVVFGGCVTLVPDDPVPLGRSACAPLESKMRRGTLLAAAILPYNLVVQQTP